METDMKDNLLLAKNMDGEKLFMQMEKNMKENEETILKMVWELTRLKRVKYIIPIQRSMLFCLFYLFN